MKNISFDNPYLLLLAIPLIAIVVISYFVVMNRDNKAVGSRVSLMLHIAMVLLVVLAVAGLKKTVTVTKTQVLVLADASYSTSREAQIIDGYILNVLDELPDNSELGVVCFGRDALFHTRFGESVRSVSGADVDGSGTDIAEALKYAASLFDINTNRRIVLITDGKDSSRAENGDIIRALNTVKSQGIEVDALYLDSNLSDGEREIQISDVLCNESTYLNKENTAEILVQSSYDGAVKLISEIKSPGSDSFVRLQERTVNVYKGFNSFELSVESSKVGEYDYRVSIEKFENGDDISPFNNTYIFSQTVTSGIKVLLICPSDANANSVKALIGDNAETSVYLVNEQSSEVPCTVQELCKYDEIIISDVDIRNIANVTSFVGALDVAVSQFGKTLLTVGDLSIQNKDDDDLQTLQDMLALRFGNPNKNGKLFTIVLDASYSMDQAMKFKAEKTAAKHLVTLLDKDDEVMIVSFAGGFKIEAMPTKASDKDAIMQTIDSITPKQGSMIGAGLDAAYEIMSNMTGYEEMQIMLISDGVTFAHEPESARDVAAKLKEKNITVSAINVLGREAESKTLLQNVAALGGGKYYYLENVTGVDELIFSSVANDVTETVIEEKTPVEINLIKDPTVSGIMLLPDVYGYVQSAAKSDAKVVIKIKPEKDGDVTVPIYSYRDYGNGRVANFTSSLSKGWLDGWSSELQQEFFVNMLYENLPNERIDYPFVIQTEYDGEKITATVLPAELKADAEAKLTVTNPRGEIIEIPMSFNSRNYVASFEANENGKYEIEVVYSYLGNEYSGKSLYNVAYAPEYNAFEVFTPSDVYDFMNGVGSVGEDGKVSLEADLSKTEFYRYNLAIPLLAAAIALFVIDIMIRKLKLSDVKSLFSSKKTGGNI